MLKLIPTLTFCLLITCSHLFAKPVAAANTNVPTDTVYIPVDINDCLVQLDKVLSDSSKTNIAAMTEDQFIKQAYRSLGMWIRNHWGLWQGSHLAHYFRAKGVKDPEGISVIILRCYHSHILKQDIRFEERIKEAHEAEEKEKQEHEEAIKKQFSAYHNGDTVHFKYDMGYTSKAQEKQKDDETCIASGIIVDTKEPEH